MLSSSCATAAGFSAKPKRHGELAGSGLRRELAEALDLEASAFEPAVELIAGEAEPPMRRLLAQELELMRREIDHEQPAARRQQARSLATAAAGSSRKCST